MNRKKLSHPLPDTWCCCGGIANRSGASRRLAGNQSKYLDPSITIQNGGRGPQTSWTRRATAYTITTRAKHLSACPCPWPVLALRSMETRPPARGPGRVQRAVDPGLIPTRPTSWMILSGSWAKQVQTADGQNEDYLRRLLLPLAQLLAPTPMRAGMLKLPSTCSGKHDTLTYSAIFFPALM